jgi:hypothetical protein
MCPLTPEWLIAVHWRICLLRYGTHSAAEHEDIIRLTRASDLAVSFVTLEALGGAQIDGLPRSSPGQDFEAICFQGPTHHSLCGPRQQETELEVVPESPHFFIPRRAPASAPLTAHSYDKDHNLLSLHTSATLSAVLAISGLER